MFGVKDPIRCGVRTCVSLQVFMCGLYCLPMSAKPLSIYPHVCVRKHLVSDGTSHIFRHLKNSQERRTLCSDEYFNILDHSSTALQQGKLVPFAQS